MRNERVDRAEALQLLVLVGPLLVGYVADRAAGQPGAVAGLVAGALGGAAIALAFLLTRLVLTRG
jgi:hypothetical protein